MEEFKNENGLKVLGGWILGIGILLSVIIFATTAIVRDPSYTYLDKYLFNWTGLIYSLICLLSSILIRQFLLVISNISISLKEIKQIMENKAGEKVE